MRSLCVLPNPSPWPLSGGWSIRQWNMLLGLRSLGDVDVWMLSKEDAARASAFGRELGARRVHSGVAGVKTWSRSSEFRWMTLSRDPKAFDRLDFESTRQEFRQWLSDDYDIALYADPRCYAAFGRLVDAPAIVDLDDVPDLWAAREFRLDQQQFGRRRLLPRVALRSARRRIDIRRWRGFQADLSGQALRLVCSDDDRRYLGGDGVAVVPNVYERNGPPRGRLDVASPPTILFQGSFDYRPNADAVASLANDLLPRIRRLLPGTGLVVAGHIDAQAAASLSELEGVRVLGFVAHIEDALELADLIAVPLRLGGGTRIKILEAFAHRIPVVSTSIGAEGLNIESGRDLLVADDPDDFAKACVEALRDRGLRERLTEAAFRLVEAEYGAADMRRRFASLVHGVAADFSGTPPPGVDFAPPPDNRLQFDA